jgi:hypothetical protein
MNVIYIAGTQQTKDIHHYRNIKEKQYKTNALI